MVLLAITSKGRNKLNQIMFNFRQVQRCIFCTIAICKLRQVSFIYQMNDGEFHYFLHSFDTMLVSIIDLNVYVMEEHNKVGISEHKIFCAPQLKCALIRIQHS